MSYFTPYVHVFNQQKESAATPDHTRSDSAAHRQQSSEINRLLTAAVVSRRFCQLLLTDPAAALEQGFNGESFALSPEEQAWVLSIRATTLKEFAEQLLASPYASRTSRKETISPEVRLEHLTKQAPVQSSAATPLIPNRLRKAS